MPFTPIHMGPALAIKALCGRYFSVLSFGISQIAMDIEPLVRMLWCAEVVHGPSHTYLAAILIAFAVVFISPPLCRLILRRWNRELAFHQLSWLAEDARLTRVPIIAGAFSGTISHVALDSIMHSDMMPLAPWSIANGLLGVISISALHKVCFVTGVLGIVGLIFIKWKTSRVGGSE